MKKLLLIENNYEWLDDRYVHGFLIVDVETEEGVEEIINTVKEASEELKIVYDIQMDKIRNTCGGKIDKEPLRKANEVFYKTVGKLGEYYKSEDPDCISINLEYISDEYFDE